MPAGRTNAGTAFYLRRERRRRIFKLWLGSALVAFIILSASAAAISRAERFRINLVEVSGNSVVSEKEIIAFAGSILGGSYLGVFPKDNIFIYPENELVWGLLQKYKRLRVAEMFLSESRTLRVKVEERKPFALWCGSEGPKGANGCFFMDAGGYVFAPAPDFSGSVFFRYYGRIEEDPKEDLKKDPIGRQFLTSQKFENLKFFAEGLKELSLSPVSLFVDEKDVYMAYLSGGGTVIFDENKDFGRLLEDLRLVISGREELRESDFSDLDYIDLRFGNKIFYKFK